LLHDAGYVPFCLSTLRQLGDDQNTMMLLLWQIGLVIQSSDAHSFAELNLIQVMFQLRDEIGPEQWLESYTDLTNVFVFVLTRIVWDLKDEQFDFKPIIPFLQETLLHCLQNNLDIDVLELMQTLEFCLQEQHGIQ
jgi:hypothetical protein